MVSTAHCAGAPVSACQWETGRDMKKVCRSQWPRGLRHMSAAARLLRLWVRIPPRAWMFVVSVVCCQVEVCATG